MGIRTIKITKSEMEFQVNKITEIFDGDAIIQRVKNRIKLWLGEWFLDIEVTGVEQGFDWEDILNNQLDNERFKEELRIYIEADETVDFIDGIEVNVDRKKRILKVTFRGKAVEGFSISGSVSVEA